MIREKHYSRSAQRWSLRAPALASISENFRTYGIKILLFARLTPGVRSPIFVTAGIVHLPVIRFLVADAIYGYSDKLQGLKPHGDFNSAYWNAHEWSVTA